MAGVESITKAHNHPRLIKSSLKLVCNVNCIRKQLYPSTIVLYNCILNKQKRRHQDPAIYYIQ